MFAAVPTLLLLSIVLVAAELLLRAKYDGVEQITGVADWQVGRFGELTYHWDRYHPSYGWTNIPGYVSDERVPFRVTINGQGLRATCTGSGWAR